MERIPERALADKYGNVKSWDEVRSTLRSNLSSRFRRVNPVIIEDVTGDVLIRLMSYWQTLASSREQDILTFEKALFYGQRFGATLIYGEVRHQQVEISHTFRSGAHDDEDEDGELYGNSEGLEEFLYRVVAESGNLDPTVEEVVEERDLAERARRVLEDLPPDELADWFDHLLTDESGRAQAKREGVTEGAVRKRRNVRRTRARKVGLSYGVWF